MAAYLAAASGSGVEIIRATFEQASLSHPPISAIPPLKWPR
jgi:hypothetical protein